MLDAGRAAHRHLGIVLKPSGATGLAGTKVYRDRFAGQTAGVVHRGDNPTPEQMTQWLG